jgi:hypothetical protein
MAWTGPFSLLIESLRLWMQQPWNKLDSQKEFFHLSPCPIESLWLMDKDHWSQFIVLRFLKVLFGHQAFRLPC